MVLSSTGGMTKYESFLSVGSGIDSIWFLCRLGAEEANIFSWGLVDKSEVKEFHFVYIM